MVGATSAPQAHVSRTAPCEGTEPVRDARANHGVNRPAGEHLVRTQATLGHTCWRGRWRDVPRPIAGDSLGDFTGRRFRTESDPPAVSSARLKSRRSPSSNCLTNFTLGLLRFSLSYIPSEHLWARMSHAAGARTSRPQRPTASGAISRKGASGTSRARRVARGGGASAVAGPRRRRTSPPPPGRGRRSEGRLRRWEEGTWNLGG